MTARLHNKIVDRILRSHDLENPTSVGTIFGTMTVLHPSASREQILAAIADAFELAVENAKLAETDPNYRFPRGDRARNVAALLAQATVFGAALVASLSDQPPADQVAKRFFSTSPDDIQFLGARLRELLP